MYDSTLHRRIYVSWKASFENPGWFLCTPQQRRKWPPTAAPGDCCVTTLCQISSLFPMKADALAIKHAGERLSGSFVAPESISAPAAAAPEFMGFGTVLRWPEWWSGIALDCRSEIRSPIFRYTWGMCSQRTPTGI